MNSYKKFEAQFLMKINLKYKVKCALIPNSWMHNREWLILFVVCEIDRIDPIIESNRNIFFVSTNL